MSMIKSMEHSGVQTISLQGVLIFQVSLYYKAPFGTIARCPDYAGVHIFKCPD